MEQVFIPDVSHGKGTGPVRCVKLSFRWLLSLTLLVVLSFPARGADDGQFLLHVSQAVYRYPRLSVYLDVFSEDGRSVPPMQRESFSVIAGGLRLPVRSVVPFAQRAEGIAYIFLVDVSRSLREMEMAEMRRAISSWVRGCRPGDRFALVTFGSGVNVRRDFTADRKVFLSAVQKLRPTDMFTSLHGALMEAQHLGKRRDSALPGRRVVVVLSDGKNEARYGMTVREVLKALREGPVPVFALGFYHPPYDEKKEYLEQLRHFARVSGGAYFSPGDSGIEAVFTELRNRIDNTWVLESDVSEIVPRGQELRVEVGLPMEGRFLADSLRVRFNPPALDAFTFRETVSQDVSLPMETVSGTDIEVITLKSWANSTENEVGESRSAVAPFSEEERNPDPDRQGAGLPVLPGIGLLGVLLVMLFARRAGPLFRKGSGIEDSSISPRASGLSCRGDLALRIEVFRGRHQVRSFRCCLEDVCRIGRLEDNELSVVDDPAISGHHCELVLLQRELAVRDLSSTNGTFLNNFRIEVLTPVRDGDLLRIGQTSLHIVYESKSVSPKGGV